MGLRLPYTTFIFMTEWPPDRQMLKSRKTLFFFNQVTKNIPKTPQFWELNTCLIFYSPTAPSNPLLFFESLPKRPSAAYYACIYSNIKLHIIMKIALFFQMYIKETSAFFRWTVREEKHVINGTIPLYSTWNGIGGYIWSG